MAPRGVLIESLSWKEAEAALARASLVLVPVGARTKEHGLHLPLNNDWLMAEYLAGRVLAELDVVQLPTVPYGYYPAFLEYPGSVSIGCETFRDLMADICRSICRHGPKKVYVLNTGVSTNRALEPCRQLLAAEGITMDYTRMLEGLHEAEKQVMQQSEGTHADEIETSMMMYMAPGLARMELAQPDIHPSRRGGLTRDPHAARGTYSPTGAWGDPTLATLEKGRVCAEALVAHLLTDIRRLLAPDHVAAPPRPEFL